MNRSSGAEAGRSTHGPRSRPTAAGAVLLVALACIYLPDLGHGFIKDDFVWIARSALHTRADLAQLLRAPTGFFRPVVSLSFGVNRSVCGLDPFCYGAANFGLLLVCAGGIFWLARSLALPSGAALFAAAVWAFNVHGINMAVLWISGRTALLLTAWCLVAAVAFVKRRYAWSALFLLGAMLSKEEAIALPLILGSWRAFTAMYDRDQRSAREWTTIGCALAIPLVVYFALRAHSGALTAATAPEYYRFSFTAGRFFSNLIQYADRSMTFPAAVVALLLIAVRPAKPDSADVDRSVLMLGALWLIGGFAITIFLPVRSSLYVCFPSVGAALIAALVVNAAWRTASANRRRVAIAGGLLLPFLLWPVYHTRNGRWVAEAELSRSVLNAVAPLAADADGPPATIVLVDDPNVRPSLADAFGTLIEEAVSLIIGSGVHVSIEPPPPGSNPGQTTRREGPARVLRLHNGRLEP